MTIESIQDMITDGRQDLPDGGIGELRRGYYVGASCEHVIIGSSDAGPLLVNWLAAFMAPKGHSLADDGFPGTIPSVYTGMIQARIDEKDARIDPNTGDDDTDFKFDWAVLGFSGACIIDAMAENDYPTIDDQVINIGLLGQLAHNVFFSELCPSQGRSVPYLYDSFSVTQEQFNERWTTYAAAYKAALQAEGATPIQIWSEWEPSLKNAPPFGALGDYHPSSESARLAAIALLNEVEKVYT
jgi:hypothetical protein